MKAYARRIHLIIGLTAFVIFLYTGYYLRIHGPVWYIQDRWRFSLRGNHIYILMSSFLHLCLGAYLRISTVTWRAALQLTGSFLITAATAVLIAAFFYESKAELDRPATLVAMISGLTGTAFHVISTVKDTAVDISPIKADPRLK